MNNFEFLEYQPVSGEKFLGVCALRAWGKIILRYKIIPTKDGSSFFAAPSSVKIGEKYESSFMLDSNFENKALQDMIREKVSDHINQPVKAKVVVCDSDDVPF
jgi:hypothetical protein